MPAHGPDDVVLFDLDGTITEPAVGITASFRHALASVDHHVHPDEDLTWVIGPPIRDNLHRVGLPEHLHDEVITTYRSRHLEVGLYEADLIPGMADVLGELVADGRRIALATAKPLLQATLTLEHFGIDRWFAAVAGAHPDARTSTKASIVADVLAQLGHPPRATMVGDRRHDVDGGRANGCRTVAVGWGFAEPGELADAAPDVVVGTAAELLATLLAPW